MRNNELIVCFANLSWDFMWLRHQELMTQFARAGQRVLFIEPIGLRMPGWQDRRRIFARIRNRRRAGPRGVRQVAPNVWALDPFVNPFQEIGFVHRRNVRALTAQVQNALAVLDGGVPLVWTYIPTPLARATIANLPRRMLIYDCVDALTENPKGVFASYAAAEQNLSREADIVFVTSHALYERQRALNPYTYYVPHGVLYEKFAGPPPPLPRAWTEIPAPRLLFFGGIDERLDLKLLARLAARQPAWQILLMGVVRTDLAALQKFPNVHLLPPQPHDALPAYLHHADAFLLPYAYIPFSHYMNPVKLYECLAVGKPTIATALPAFDEARDVLYVAQTADEYERLAHVALAEKDDAAKIQARRARARANTWAKRFAEIQEIIAKRQASS